MEARIKKTLEQYARMTYTAWVDGGKFEKYQGLSYWRFDAYAFDDNGVRLYCYPVD